MKQVKRISGYLVIFLLLVLTACGKEVADKKKVANLYIEVLLTEEMYSFNPDSIKIKQDSLFNAYGISREVFNNTIESFGPDREAWEEFFNMAKTHLDTLREANTK